MRRHMEGLLWVTSLACLAAAGLVTNRSYLLGLSTLWAAATAVVLPLHFVKAWKRLPAVAGKRAYVA